MHFVLRVSTRVNGFSWMNIHLPAILGFTRYQGFDPSPSIQNMSDQLLMKQGGYFMGSCGIYNQQYDMIGFSEMGIEMELVVSPEY